MHNFEQFRLPYEKLLMESNQDSEYDSQDPQIAETKTCKPLVAAVPARERIKQGKKLKKSIFFKD